MQDGKDKIKIPIIITPLNTMGFSYSRETNKQWLLKRLDHMRRFTAESLAIQTREDFQWHILTREETLNFVKLNFNHPDLDYKILTPKQSDQMICSIDSSFDNDDILLIRLNSDDCYHKDFIKILNDFEYTIEKEALVFQNGFMWYQEENIIVERNFPSPPFYAFIYKLNSYKNGFRYDVAGHNHIRKELKTHALREKLWLWIVNENCNKIQRGSKYPPSSDFPEVNKSVLKEFGIYDQ